MNEIFKIGVIIQGFQMNRFEKDLIEKLNSSKLNIKLYAILEHKKKENLFSFILRKINQHGLFRLFELILFKIIFFLEKNLLKFFFPKVKYLENKFLLDRKIFHKIINVKPVFSKYKIFSDYSNKDKDLILKENLDIVLRGNVYEIFRSNKLNIAKFGIISFHHGDFTWNRGGPPGFWETVLDKISSGFIIQILNENLDNGKVIFKGEFPTQKLYVLNLLNLLAESNNHIIKVIEKILLTQNIEIISNSQSFKNKILKAPNYLYSLKYIFKKIKLFLLLSHRKYIKKTSQRWEVCFSRSNLHQYNFKEFKKIKNFEGRFFADPFIFKKGLEHYIFVEDFFKDKKKGSISVIKIDDNDEYKIYEKVIDEDFHMSYPFIFEYKDKIYMTPETSTKGIRLYECIKFPDVWKYNYSLIENTKCVDTNIVYHDKLYWLFTSQTQNKDFSSQQYIYYSDSPISQIWTEHPNNPIFFDIINGRNGGSAEIKDQKYRMTQSYGFNKYNEIQYGHSLKINKIEKLDKKNFLQTEFKDVNQNDNPSIIGIHHVNSIDNFIVFDRSYFDKF